MIHLAYIEIVAHFEGAFREPLFILYLASAIVDVVLGNIRAWSMNDVDSHVGVRGTMKHLGVFTFVVLLLPPLAYYLGNNAVSLGILTYLVYQYLISIIENLGQLGFDVPTVFKEKLRRLDDDSNEEENK